MVPRFVPRRLAAIERGDHGLRPIRLAVDRIAPFVDPTLEGTDQLSHPPSEAGIVEPELPMRGIHCLDEALGKCRGCLVAFRTSGFEPDDHKRADCGKHREPAVNAVGDLALDIPVRPPGVGHHSVEQRPPAGRRAR